MHRRRQVRQASLAVSPSPRLNRTDSQENRLGDHPKRTGWAATQENCFLKHVGGRACNTTLTVPSPSEGAACFVASVLASCGRLEASQSSTSRTLLLSETRESGKTRTLAEWGPLPSRVSHGALDERKTRGASPLGRALLLACPRGSFVARLALAPMGASSR